MVEASKEITVLKTKTSKLYGAKVITSPLLIVVLATTIYMGVMMFYEQGFRDVFLLLIFGYVFLIVLSMLTTYKGEVILTEQRLIYNDGHPNHEPKDIPLKNIENSEVYMPLVGRVLKYGTIELSIKEQRNIESINGVPQPKKFNESLKNALSEIEEQTVSEN